MIVQGCGPCRWVTKHPNAQPVESPEVVANRELMKSRKFPLVEDTRYYCDVMQTTFRKDFPNWGYLGRPQIARLPPLGPIIQRDDRCLDWVGSETKLSFDLGEYEKPEIVDGYEKYFGTNFRFNEDIRTSSYEPTTGSAHRKLKVTEFADDFDRKALWRTSNIMRGDRDRLLPGVSHYKDEFREGAKSIPPVHGGYVSGPTIVGDARESDYVTTFRAAYKKLPDSRCPPVRPPVEADVWTASKFPHPSTIFQSDFQRHADDDTSALYIEGQRLHEDNRERNLRANYVYQDGACDMDRYQKSLSTRDYHSRIRDVSRPKLGPDFHVQSHLIFGDVDRVNGTTETSTYTHDYDEKEPPGTRPIKDYTDSSIRLGDSNVLEYKTTSGEHAKFDPAKTERAVPPVNLQASHLPFDLYPGPVGPTIYTSDFQKANQCKLELNEDRLREMKQSNFREHRDDRFGFDTTEYHDHFVRKAGGGVLDVQETIRRNRKSSVPLGTIPQCD